MKIAKESHEKCSIIIPFRNEEENLGLLFQSLIELDYPKNKFEVVLVDDHSNDGSNYLIQSLIKSNSDFPIKLLTLKKGEGKKTAIALGILESNFDIILQTDADCIVQPSWVSEMIKSFSDPRVNAVLGKVKMISDSSSLGDLMALEFTSLQASGISLALMQIPIMSNGANMAYRKSQIPEKLLGDKWASGDDAFLIQSLSKADRVSVKVSLDSPVLTKVPKTIREFFRQRLRWGSKTPDYPMQQGKWIAILVFLLSLTQVLLLVFGIWEISFLKVFGILYILKLIPDYLLIGAYLKPERGTKLLSWIPLLALIYPFYISFTALFIILGTNGLKWKDRPIRL